MVETVLPSPKFEDRVTATLAAGYRFGFVYVTVQSHDLNEARVRHRVARGGHDVPADLIRARRQRSHAAMTAFAARADLGLVFDNSGMEPVLLAERPLGGPGWRTFDPDRLAAPGLHLPA